MEQNWDLDSELPVSVYFLPFLRFLVLVAALMAAFPCVFWLYVVGLKGGWLRVL